MPERVANPAEIEALRVLMKDAIARRLTSVDQDEHDAAGQDILDTARELRRLGAPYWPPARKRGKGDARTEAGGAVK